MSKWLGIDVGKGAVKVAVVRSSYRKLLLENVASVDVATYGEGVEATEQAIRAAIAMALGGADVKGDTVATTIEGFRTSIHNLSLPATVERQLVQVLPFELEAQIPFDMSEAVFDHRIIADRVTLISDTESNAKATVSVLACIARTAEVQERIHLLKRALGIEPERIEPGAFPLANLIPHISVLSESGPIAVVDLGMQTSDVIVIYDKAPVFSRALSYGTDGLPASAPRLAREIRVTIAAFRAGGGAPVTQVYLCGGGAFVSGAEGFLANELDLPVAVLPAPAIESPLLSPEQLSQLPRFSKAVGLALGLGPRPLGLDLRKGPLTSERGFGWMKEKAPVLLGLAAAILVSFVFSAIAQFYTTSKEQSVLEKALSDLSKQVLGEETTSAVRVNELLAQQTASSDEDPMPQADAFDVMVKFSEAVPQSIVSDVEELDVQKGHVVIHGIVGSIDDAQFLAKALGSERCFSDVKITRTNQVVGGERQKYVLEFDLKCQKENKTGARKDTTRAAATPSSSTAAEGRGP